MEGTAVDPLAGLMTAGEAAQRTSDVIRVLVGSRSSASDVIRVQTALAISMKIVTYISNFVTYFLTAR